VTHDRTTPDEARKPHQKALANTYYALLGVHPSASVREVRQAYRELSKLYHPDTTTLPQAVATAKFQQLNEAYATLSSPERRSSYDQKIGYSRLTVIQPLPNLHQSAQSKPLSNAYLDPTDRPLSPGEVFALFILGLTFVGCLILAIAIGITRGGDSLAPAALQPPAPEIQVVVPVEQSIQANQPTQPESTLVEESLGGVIDQSAQDSTDSPQLAQPEVSMQKDTPPATALEPPQPRLPPPASSSDS
jgi:hypothetical protein